MKATSATGRTSGETGKPTNGALRRCANGGWYLSLTNATARNLATTTRRLKTSFPTRNYLALPARPFLKTTQPTHKSTAQWVPTKPLKLFSKNSYTLTPSLMPLKIETCCAFISTTSGKRPWAIMEIAREGHHRLNPLSPRYSRSTILPPTSAASTPSWQQHRSTRPSNITDCSKGCRQKSWPKTRAMRP